MTGGLPTAGLLPFNLIEYFLHQGFRILPTGKPPGRTLKHLNAHRAAQGEPKTLVIEVGESRRAFGGLATDDAGFVLSVFRIHAVGPWLRSGLG